MGAWIETLGAPIASLSIDVAPYVGAWIETASVGGMQGIAKSHPMWVRGLKLHLLTQNVFVTLSHPMWVRGLKP